MKKEKITSFLSGVVSCTLVLGLATTALAATGNVSFGRVNVRLNSKEVFAQGEELRTDAGHAIPSSITYTDETGGDTTYVPLSYLSRLLDTPVGWDQASKTVKLGYSAALPGDGKPGSGGIGFEETDNPSAGLTDLPLKAVGSVAAPSRKWSPSQPTTWIGVFPMRSPPRTIPLRRAMKTPSRCRWATASIAASR